MKKITSVLMLMFSVSIFAQSTITITTEGGSWPTEKWVNITTSADGTGTQIWGQGNGTYGNGEGLLTDEEVMLAPGTYWVNCYDRFDDGWDGTLISVEAYGAVIGDNGGVSPSDGNDEDANSTWEDPSIELEASFQIVVPNPPSCLPPTNLSASTVTDTTASLSWTPGGTVAGYEYALLLASDPAPTSGTQTTATSFDATGLTSSTDYVFYVRSFCNPDFSTFTSIAFSTTAAQVPNNFISGAIPITPSPDGTGCQTAQFTLDFASNPLITTDSGLDGSCNGTNTGLDRFFTWTATTDGLRFLDTSPGNPGIVIRDTSGNQIDCAQTLTNIAFPNGDLLSGWTVGQELIIQIYDFGTSSSDVAFCLEAVTLPTPPDCTPVPVFPMDGATEVEPFETILLDWDAPTSGVTPTAYNIYSSFTSGNLSLFGTVDAPDTSLEASVGAYDTTVYWRIVPVNNGVEATSGCTEYSFTTQSAPAAPSNNDFVNAAVLTESFDSSCNNVVSGTTESATASTEDDCSTTNKDVWYTFTPLQTTTYVFNVSETFDSGFSSTYVSLFEGSSGALTQVNSSCFSGTFTADLSMGTTYYVNVRSTSASSFVTFDLCAYPAPPPPTNDACADATVVTSLPYSGMGDATSATNNDGFIAITGCGSMNDGVWYTYTPANDVMVNISSTPSGWDNEIGVFSGSCGAFTCVDNTDAGISGVGESLTVSLTGGTQYFINIAYFSGITDALEGMFTIDIAELPPNDDCVDAIALTLGSEVTGDTTNATDSGVDAGTCGATGEDKDVWYSFEAPVSGEVVFTTTADHVVVYDSCGGTEVGCVGNMGEILGLTSGQTYYARIYNNGLNARALSGPFTLTVSDKALSNSDYNNNVAFTYYPNPVKKVLTLVAPQNIDAVSVYNMLGQEVLRSAPETLNAEVDMSTLKAGTYFVKVSIDKNVKTVRVIRQ